MPVQIGDKELLFPKEVRAKFPISESKLRRLAQLNIIPSIPFGTRGESNDPEQRLYDEQDLRKLDPAIWENLRSGVKKPGKEHQYYSHQRRKS